MAGIYAVHSSRLAVPESQGRGSWSNVILRLRMDSDGRRRVYDTVVDADDGVLLVSFRGVEEPVTYFFLPLRFHTIS